MQVGGEDRAIFIQAVRADDSIPIQYRENAESVQSLERRILDESYLMFLREQIEWETRGPEWADTLSKRLRALSPFVGCPRLNGFVVTVADGSKGCFVDVDPVAGRVIRWEEYGDSSTAEWV